jgi:hypothetical protein
VESGGRLSSTHWRLRRVVHCESGTAAANTPALTLDRALGFDQVGHKIVGDNIAYVELRHPGRG